MAASALVVDDDPDILGLASQWLTAQGYQVTAAADFRAAQALVRARGFDLLLIDVRLGEFNGLQLAIQVRDAVPQIRIVVMSGWDDVTVAREAAACRAVVLAKPFTPEALLDAVRSAGV